MLSESSRRIGKTFAITAGVWLILLGFNSVARAGDRGRKYTPPPPTSQIKVTVLRGTTSKPIANAAVVFHPIKNGKDTGALELKSDEDGVVKIDVIPIGDTVRLQVIADGWQTYGEDYKIETDRKEIVVKMKRPGSQYSLYGPGSSSSINQTAPTGQSTSAKPNRQTPLPQ
ncbi:MAG TPA: hypothetical protein VGM27_05105 [Acidobacteriaceae bacterium]|jgi:hypothetical protein